MKMKTYENEEIRPGLRFRFRTTKTKTVEIIITS